MTFADASFISLATLTDATQHHAHNAWHQLDHLPENLLLPGVLHGQRWVRTPACAAASGPATAPFDDFQYLTLYWFRPPVEDSIGHWAALAEQSFQWGRRPEVAWTARPYMGFFRPVKGYAATRIDISAPTLPLRPNRGIYLAVSQVAVDAADRTEVEARFRWYDRVGLPDLVSRPGVAGAWSLVDDAALAPASWTQREQQAPGQAAGRAEDQADTTALRVTVAFLDEDPLTVAASLAEDNPLVPAPDGPETLLFAGPLQTIEPWTWDWFDADPA